MKKSKLDLSNKLLYSKQLIALEKKIKNIRKKVVCIPIDLLQEKLRLEKLLKD